MIVKCDKCQTRFKIPDEKVTEKGVKVRCTKCQNTFKVTKATDAGAGAPAASPPPPPPPAPQASVDPDPFSRFGIGQGPAAHESTRPGVFNEGIAATREPARPIAPIFSAQQDVPSEVFDQPTRVAPIPKGLFDPPPPAPEQSAPATDAGGFDPSNPFEAASADPFALLPPPAPPVASVTPPPPPAAARAPDSRPPTDFELTSPTMPTFQPPPAAFPPPAPPSSSAASKVATAARAAATSAPSAAAIAPASSAAADPFLAAMDNEPTATSTSTDLLGSLPPPDEDLFARPGSPLTSGPMTAENPAFGAAAAPDRAMFDMPSAPPPALGDEQDSQPTSEQPAPTGVSIPLARIALAQVAVEKPAGRPEDVGMAEERRPGNVRRTFGLVANLVVATLLVLGLVSVGTIYLNEGKLDLSALSLEPVKALFAAPGDLLPVDVSNGLYDTRGGRPVFYVRGEVENRGDKASRVKVNVEILDGATTLTRAEALAGASPTPEELHAVSSAQEMTELVARLDKAATEVKPGGRAPFLIAFYEYPPDLAQYRLKVTVQEAAPETAAR